MRRLRAVTYARVSSEKEMQAAAFENQILWYEKIKDRMSDQYEFVGHYQDKGITGTAAKKRPGFMKMIDDAKKGMFDIIITREVSRFARNFIESVSYTRELAGYGVEVYFINENIHSLRPDDQFKMNLMSMMAEEECRRDSERCKAGVYIAMHQKDSIWGTGNILGYNPRHGRNQPFTINEEEAETVILIKDLYLAGKSLTEIKIELERLGRKTATGEKLWQISSISRILDNPFYAGYQRLGQVKVNNFLEQKKIKQPKEEIFLKKINVPTLYTIEEYNKIQEIKKQRLQTTEGLRVVGKRKHVYTWSSKLLCSCGFTMVGYIWRIVRGNEEAVGYRCRNQVINRSKAVREKMELDTEAACDNPSIPEWKLEFMAKHIFEHLWSNRGVEIEEALEIVRECYKDDKQDMLSEINNLNAKIAKYKNKKSNLIDMCADDLLDKDTLRKKLEECDENIKLYENNIANLKTRSDSTIMSLDDLIESIRSTMKETLDFSTGVIDRTVISKMVDIVYYEKKGTFKWFLNLSNKNYHKSIDDFNKDESVTPENCNIPVEHQIRMTKRMAFKPYTIVKDKRKLVYSTTLTYEQARAYRKANGSFMRPNAWDDLHIEVYV